MRKKIIKLTKSVWIKEWVSRILDFEGEQYNGPGEVCSAAAYDFFCKKDTEKLKIIQNYRNIEAAIDAGQKPEPLLVEEALHSAETAEQDNQKKPNLGHPGV